MKAFSSPGYPDAARAAVRLTPEQQESLCAAEPKAFNAAPRALASRIGVSEMRGGVPQRTQDELIAAWRTTARATAFLIERLPPSLWSRPVPGVPRLTVARVAAHLHNSRCRWIRSLGAGHGIKPPRLVDLRRVGQGELVKALSRSSDGMVRLIRLGMDHGGRVPRATWQNFPTDMPHFLTYFAAHEGHHRGQLCLVARQLGARLPRGVADGIWQWTRLSREPSRPGARLLERQRGASVRPAGPARSGAHG